MESCRLLENFSNLDPFLQAMDCGGPLCGQTLDLNCFAQGVPSCRRLLVLCLSSLLRLCDLKAFVTGAFDARNESLRTAQSQNQRHLKLRVTGESDLSKDSKILSVSPVGPGLLSGPPARIFSRQDAVSGESTWPRGCHAGCGFLLTLPPHCTASGHELIT